MGPSPKDPYIEPTNSLGDYLGDALERFKTARDRVLVPTPELPVQPRPAAYPAAELGAPAGAKPAAPAPVTPAAPAKLPPAPPVVPPAAPIVPKPAATYPNTDTLSNLGDTSAARELASRSGKAVGIGTASDYAAAEPGRVRLINAAPGQESNNSMVATPSQRLADRVTLGSAPFEPSIGQPTPSPLAVGDTRLIGPGAPQADVRGASSTPMYETNYTLFGANGPKGTASIVGPNQRAGGGTVSAPDQGNGGTVEGNVAALNRQAEALRSVREARNPGITTGGGFGQGSPAPIDPFARPGDSWGDSEKRAQEYQSLLREAATGSGLTKGQRAAKVQAAQALVTPGLEVAKLAQEGQRGKDSLAAQLAQNQAASEDRRFGVQAASEDRRYAADQALAGHKLTAQQQAEKNAIAAARAYNEWLGLAPKPSVDAEYLNLLSRKRQATDPAVMAQIDQEMQALRDFKRAPDSSAALFNQPPTKN